MTIERALGVGECAVCGATVLGEAAQLRHVDWHESLLQALTLALETAAEAKQHLFRMHGGWPANGKWFRQGEVVGVTRDA